MREKRADRKLRKAYQAFNRQLHYAVDNAPDALDPREMIPRDWRATFDYGGAWLYGLGGTR